MKQLQKGKKMLEDKLLRLYVKAACFKMSSERGDTNFNYPWHCYHFGRCVYWI